MQGWSMHGRTAARRQVGLPVRGVLLAANLVVWFVGAFEFWRMLG